MNFLLDTNVVSEWVKPKPNPGVVSWLANVDEDRVFLSVVTIVELRYGIERLAASARRKVLSDWLEQDLSIRFEGRILRVDESIADVCGRVLAESERLGRRMEAMNALIAATAQVHSCTIVTRNSSDFQVVVDNTIDPWEW